MNYKLPEGTKITYSASGDFATVGNEKSVAQVNTIHLCQYLTGNATFETAFKHYANKETIRSLLVPREVYLLGTTVTGAHVIAAGNNLQTFFISKGWPLPDAVVIRPNGVSFLMESDLAAFELRDGEMIYYKPET